MLRKYFEKEKTSRSFLETFEVIVSSGGRPHANHVAGGVIVKLAVLFMRILNWEVLGMGREGKMSNLIATEESAITGATDCVIVGGDHVGGMCDYSSVCNPKESEQWMSEA